jgi:hypothetical protein
VYEFFSRPHTIIVLVLDIREVELLSGADHELVEIDA